LGFDYTLIANGSLDEALDAIETALGEGRPVLTGINPRFWNLVVGIDREAGELLLLGGPSWHDWTPVRADEGEYVAPFGGAELARRVPIPREDWISNVLGPGQAARNAVFIVGDRHEPQAPVVATLARAMELRNPDPMERKEMELRAEGEERHRGLAAFEPRPGRFLMGTSALRAWADAVEGLGTPTHNFGIVHANDTTLGMQLLKLRYAAQWLDRVALTAEPETAAHLRAAREAMRRAHEQGLKANARLTGYLREADSPEDVARIVEQKPAVVYIAGGEQRDMLEETDLDFRPCPWGLSVIPGRPTFEKARNAAVESLRQAATLREAALEHAKSALDALLPGQTLIPAGPEGHGTVRQSNSYCMGLASILQWLGHETDYHTVMGDTGQAFILQAESGAPLVGGAVDVGWWPLDTWGVEMRLPFLAGTTGRSLWLNSVPVSTYMKDPNAAYGRHIDIPLRASVVSGRPALAYNHVAFIALGYEDADIPVRGRWACGGDGDISTPDDAPWGLIRPQEQVTSIPRRMADVRALRHALLLARDEAVEHAPPGRRRAWAGRTLYTGQKAFAEWARMTREQKDKDQPRWHANMRLHLRINRESAVDYLRGMTARHPAAAEQLEATAAAYEQTLELLQEAQINRDVMTNAGGREALAALVERIAQNEAQAADHIEAALEVMER
jgi:hypothetical protein